MTGTFDFVASVDAAIEGVYNDENNYGEGEPISLGAIYAGETKQFLYRTLVKFDVGTLYDEDIGSASWDAWIYLKKINGEDSVYGFATRCTKDWYENEVTWKEYQDGVAWTSSGGDYDHSTPGTQRSDFVHHAVGTVPQWKRINVGTYVQDALDSRGGTVNLGMLLKFEDGLGSSTWQTWRSRHWGTENERWFLKVGTYPLP